MCRIVFALTRDEREKHPFIDNQSQIAERKKETHQSERYASAEVLWATRDLSSDTLVVLNAVLAFSFQ